MSRKNVTQQVERLIRSACDSTEFTNEELQTAWDGLLTPYGKRIAKEREAERNRDKMKGKHK